ncbi:MAG: hypothetical protein HYX85_01640 [Chloroflexi bacterium]|nr:hypothetical protein [Chloroflexota bacterium]
MEWLFIIGSSVALAAAVVFLFSSVRAAIKISKTEANKVYVLTAVMFTVSMLLLALLLFEWRFAFGRTEQVTPSTAPLAALNTGLGQWGQILGGGIIAAMLTLGGREVVSYLRRPNITIMFEKDENTDSCYHRLATNPENSCWLRVKVTNIGRSTAKNCLGRLVELDDERNPTDRDPVKLHWIDTPWQEGTELFTTIDLHRGESGFLDVLLTMQEKDAKRYLFKGAERVAVSPEGTAIPKGAVLIIMGDKTMWVKTEVKRDELPSGTDAVRITVYGDNVKPCPKQYSISFEGENPKYTGIRLKEEKIARESK